MKNKYSARLIEESRDLWGSVLSTARAVFVVDENLLARKGKYEKSLLLIEKSVNYPWGVSFKIECIFGNTFLTDFRLCPVQLK